MLLMFDSSVHSKLKAYPDINAGFKLKLYIVNISVYSSTRCVRPLGPSMDHTISGVYHTGTFRHTYPVLMCVFSSR